MVYFRPSCRQNAALAFEWRAEENGMGYVEKSLVAGERVVYKAKLHWIVFAIPALFLLAAIAAFVCVQYEDKLVYLGAVLLGIAIIAGVRSAIIRSASEFAITTKRVIIKRGLLRTHSLEILLTKIEAIAVDQDFWGNIVNYGTVDIKGTGGTVEPFEKIGNPFEFRRRAQEQIMAGQDTTVHWGPQMRP
jgi:uncharacterized membrane protein YdbT with pleckstrin-like domain